MEESTGLRHDAAAFAGNVRLSYAYNLLSEFQFWLPIWVLYLRDERGFSLTQIAVLDVPFFLLVVFAEVPTGAVADRFGRKVSLMLASAFYATAVFVFGIATNYIVILVSYVAWGFAVTFRSGADVALVYDSLKHAGREEEFQRANGRLFATRSAAAMAGIVLGAPLAAATSFSFVIVISALIAGAGFFVAMLMHEPRHTLEHSHESYFRTLGHGIRDAWRNPPLRYIIFYSGIVSAGTFGALVVFQQPWLSEHGIATENLGFWQAPVRLVQVVAALSAGAVLARFGERASFFALPVVVVGCNLALAGIDQSWIAVSFLALGFVQGAHFPLLAGYVNRRVESARRATVLSVQSVVGSLILAIIHPFAGVLADAFGLQGVFLMFAVATAVFGFGVLFLWDRADRAHPAVEEPIEVEPEAVVAG